MSKSKELLSNLFEYLNKEVSYAVLRNYEGLPNNNNSRDIDIVIEKKELRKHLKNIIAIIISQDWKIVSYFDEGRMITYVCGIVGDKGAEMIQIDFFVNNSAYGILLAEPKQFLEGRVFNGAVYHVSKECEFLDKYIYNRAVGAKYPDKYNSLKELVGDSSIVKKELKSIFSIAETGIIDGMSRGQLLVRAFGHNLTNRFFVSLKTTFSSLIRYCRNFISPSSMPTVAFTGPDGAGKTTIIDRIIESVDSVWGKNISLLHFRPTLIPNLGEAAYSAGLKTEVDRDYNDPHRGKKTTLSSSFMRLCYYTLDYLLGFCLKINPQRYRRKLIIFDRYYTDIIADSRRSKIYLNPKFLYYWGKLFIPKLHYNILLTADTDVILARKQELDRKGIEDINSKLNYLSSKKGYYLVKNNGTAEEAVDKILTIIFDGQHKKNLKRI